MGKQNHSGGGRGRRAPAAMTMADVEGAEEEAAQSLEESMQKKLEAGDLEGACGAWAEALQFRERLQGADSPVVVEMRASLQLLQQAIAAKGAEDLGDSDEEDEEQTAREKSTP